MADAIKYFQRILMIYGGGGLSAVSDMAKRLGVTHSYVRRIVAGSQRAPATLRSDVSLDVLHSRLTALNALEALADRPPDGAADSYCDDLIGVKASGFSAMYFMYVALKLNPDLDYSVSFRSPDFKFRQFSIYMGFPGYIVSAYLNIFNINYEDAVIFNPESDFDIELDLNFGSGNLELPRTMPAVDLLILARSEAKGIFRPCPRANTATNQLYWALTDNVFTIEKEFFKKKWIESNNKYMAIQYKKRSPYANIIKEPLTFFTENDVLFDYMAGLSVAVNWCLYGPINFPEIDMGSANDD